MQETADCAKIVIPMTLRQRQAESDPYGLWSIILSGRESWILRTENCDQTKKQTGDRGSKRRSRLDILPIRTQKPLLLSIFITLNHLINMFQNLFLPLDGGLLILKPLLSTSRLYSSSRFLCPGLIILASDESFLLFFCEPGVVAVTEYVRVLARVAGYEGARDVWIVEEGIPKGFDEFGLVELEVAEALDAVGLFWLVLVWKIRASKVE